MGLHKKISLLFLSVLAVFAFVSYFSLSRTLIPAFGELEYHSSMQDLARSANSNEPKKEAESCIILKTA